MSLTDDLALRLGTALLHSLWQLAGLSVLLSIALAHLRHSPARLRSAAASVTLLAAVALFIVTAASVTPPSTLPPSTKAAQTITLPPHQSTAPIQPPNNASSQVDEPFETFSANSPFPSPSILFTSLWLLGIAAISLRHALGLIHIHRLRRAAPAADHPVVTAAVARATTLLNISRRIPVLVTDKLSSPALIGLAKPAVLIPASAITGLPAAQLELLIAHEFAHLKHLDPVLNHLTTAAETVLFYHPATWWIARVVRREREFACDDAVVTHFGQRYDYARALTSLQQLTINTPSTPQPALAAAGQTCSFSARIHRILGINKPATTAPATVLSLAAASALAVAISAAQTTPPTPEPQTDRAPGTRGNILDRSGTLIATSPSPSPSARTYPLGANLAHAVGYATADNGKPKGRAGVELTMDAPLAAGDDVYLTIDARIQTAAEKVLRTVGRAAAVGLDPRTGDVLALVSVPSYDPVSFAVGISETDFKQLLNNPALPLFNRTLGSYPPASTFKMVSALAALQTDNAAASFDCTGATQIGGRTFRCWKRDGHGTISLDRALTASCNCYFYELAGKIGAPALHHSASSLGFGKPTGIRLPSESAGNLADPKLSTPTRLANHVIGHGEIQATPLQIAVATSTIANGGHLHTPRIIDRITDFETATTSKTVPGNPSSANIDVKHLTVLRNAMRDTVNVPGSTGRQAKSDHFIISGKSGTAQTFRDHNGTQHQEYATWFTAFAPFDEPEIVVTVLVEHGVSGGTTSAPLVKQIIEQTLLNKLPKPTHLPPHPGHLNKVTAPN